MQLLCQRALLKLFERKRRVARLRHQERRHFSETGEKILNFAPFSNIIRAKLAILLFIYYVLTYLDEFVTLD